MCNFCTLMNSIAIVSFGIMGNHVTRNKRLITVNIKGNEKMSHSRMNTSIIKLI